MADEEKENKENKENAEAKESTESQNTSDSAAESTEETSKKVETTQNETTQAPEQQTAKTEGAATETPATDSAEGGEEEDELTGIEEASEQEIVQKVTKKESRKRRKKRDKSQGKAKEAPEWIEKVVQIRRVTKVVKGGKKLSFRAVVVVGNAKGQVGVGVGKALEVIGAIQKAIVDAKKQLVTIPLIESTIPHEVRGRAGAAKVLLKPAREGSGIKAGGAARTVLELGGVGDVLSKSLGARSPLNVARATLDGLTRLRKFNEVAKLRGITVKDMISSKQLVGAN